jgi:catechol 2,3-dioxygenase-like lactoylglutathione lyase family enzyme
MGTTAVRSKDVTPDGRFGTADLKLEVITIPVSDVARAKEFYVGLGWRLDADFTTGNERVVQVTPPGSECSVHFGTSVTNAAPGSSQGIFLIVSDIQAARNELVRRGVEASEVFHLSSFNRVNRALRLSGPSPDRSSYGSFLSFSDPDGNEWLLQEITTRLPGRVIGETAFTSVSDLAQAMRRASEAHGEHEKRTGGERDENWPSWYAAYMVAEQTGTELPT